MSVSPPAALRPVVWSRWPRPARLAEIGGVLLVGAAGLAIRGAFLWQQRGDLDADSLTIGLMARHILEGQHYAFFWGQAYMGSLEAYVAALFFALLGPGTVALQLSPLAFSVVFAAATYAWARRLGGAPAALAALALLAAGPPALTLWQITPRGGYAATLALGTLILVLAARLGDSRDGGPGRRWVALGLTSGLAFWTHLLVGVHLAAAATYLLLRDPRRLRQRGPWLAFACFALAGLPLWLSTAAEGLTTLSPLARVQPFDLGAHMVLAATENLPKLLGARALTGGEALLPWYLLVVAAGIPLAALTGLVLSLGGGLLDGRRPPELLPGLLLVFTAAAILTTPYGGVTTQRYWLPVFSVLPVVLGLWLVRLPWRLGWVCLVVLAGVQLHGHAALTPIRRADHGPLHQALEQAGIQHAYADYWVAAPLTYYSSGSLIVTALQRRWYPLEERPGFSPLPSVILPASDPAFATTLRLAGVDFVEHAAGRFAIYRPTAIRRAPQRPLPRDTWRVEAWPNAADAWKSVDGDPASRWSSRGPQRPGMWLSVDLGEVVPVSGVRLDLGPYVTDFPRTIAVELSSDGERWRTVVATEHAVLPRVRVDERAFRYDPDFAASDLQFLAIRTRFVRVSLPESPDPARDAGVDWSIAELSVLTPVELPADEPTSG